MNVLAIIVGFVLVVLVLADLVNTLVTTQTSRHPWWLTARLYRWSWMAIRPLGRRFSDTTKERIYSAYAPVSVLLLLVVWVSQQVLGFGLIWWGLDGISGGSGLFESIYFSGVVYFTLGFGEIVPTEVIPRAGALVEAFSGVLTTALVIGYLPALYGAYSERERQLMMLDDGSEDRITPSNLLMSRTPSGDPEEAFEFFSQWESWVAGVLETHTTFPMLQLFRSKYPGQHWVTALGVVTDAALQCQTIRGAQNRAPYWLVRRSIRLFEQLTAGVDLSEYYARYEEVMQSGSVQPYLDLHRQLAEHGFDVLPVDEALEEIRELRYNYSPRMEYLIDLLEAPRGFWGHAVGIPADRPARSELE